MNRSMIRANGATDMDGNSSQGEIRGAIKDAARLAETLAFANDLAGKRVSL